MTTNQDTLRLIKGLILKDQKSKVILIQDCFKSIYLHTVFLHLLC